MMKKGVKIALGVVLFLFAASLVWAYLNMVDRHRGYRADARIIEQEPSLLRVGFSALPITPDVPDRWEDVNQDARYVPADGDSFTDGNGNGKFDPVWIAGFSNRRAANGVHDDLWARTMVIEDDHTRIALVVIDAIGFMHDDVVAVRKSLPDSLELDYLIIASTHTHEGPDLLGLWGSSYLKSGVSSAYLSFVKKQIAQSVADAVEHRKLARLELSQDLTGAAHLVKDTRKPEVFDSGMRLIRAVDSRTGETLGTLMNWADHPETLWSRNLLISSDFPHFVREGIEKGVYHEGKLKKKGLGGIALYANGALGGLMATHPSLAVRDPFTDEEYKEPSFEKAHAQGQQLALLALNAMEQPEAVIEKAAISLVVRTIKLPIANTLFKLGTAFGVLNRGTAGWMTMRSEVAAIQIGPLSLVTIPGEIYPELVNGGVEAPDGGDYQIAPLEVPPIREMMPGTYKFVLGLANDEIGYIIPKSQWDVEAPYTYGRDNSPYGEENSPGPETAPLIHQNLKEILDELKQ
ncbi:neutral/alkaline non-lysosomal ceramidase N-terminal domain-containing protein [Sunxiuqinia elliptica]|nr:neutral/alkaline non-lysosomal ceramidase N-terminal domain-containing protein [Sunxiuqinia elliptica]